MDPNANLQQQLELVTEAIDLDPDELDPEEMELAVSQHVELCRLVEALNEWIRKGGFLPEVWQLGQDQLSDQYVKETLEERFHFLSPVYAKDIDPYMIAKDLQTLYDETCAGLRFKTTSIRVMLFKHERHTLVATKQQELYCRTCGHMIWPMVLEPEPDPTRRKRGHGKDILAGIVLLLAFLALMQIRA